MTKTFCNTLVPAVYRNNPDLYKAIPTFKYETQTEKFITNTPLLMDPLERATIRLGCSAIKGVTGDALIARRDIPAFSVVVYYAGVLVTDSSVSSSNTGLFLFFRSNKTILEQCENVQSVSSVSFRPHKLLFMSLLH